MKRESTLKMNKMIYRFLGIIAILFFLVNSNVQSQEREKPKVDCNKDTLIVISDKIICKNKIYINRSGLLNSDSLSVNLPGFTIYSYYVSSFTLGHNLNVNVASGIISNELKKAIDSKEIQYKFLNFSEILLLDEKNNIVKPTLYNFKIIFLD
ncbi:MAG: hypothetical protein GXO79_14160 [Chlorobi bacterium]|nr:hypothetical protein [Chlorobiota bacterium]